MKALNRCLLPVALALLQVSAPAQSDPVYTWQNFAGQPGGSGTNDDTGGAARFNRPAGVAVDSAGNIFVADTANHAIRQVTAAGVVTTLAGSPGDFGTNDGTSSAARFSYPHGVAVDGAGNVFVADTFNHTIRQVTSAGAVTTLAGSAGQYGSDDGTGSAARFYNPSGIAVDGTGNVFVADTWNHTIRRVTSGGAVSTLAGWAGQSGTNDAKGTAARFSYPSGVAVDSTGNVYVADFGNHTIRKITSGGVVTTLAGWPETSGTNDGPGDVARFYYPQGVAVDSAGTVFVADRLNHTVRKVTSVGMVSTLGGSAELSGTNAGPGSTARFNSPYGVAADSAGNLYVADTYNHRISRGSLLPALAIRRSGNSLVVSWPSPSAGFGLQQNSDACSAAGWSGCGYPITDDGTNKSITISPPAGKLFFRLSLAAPPTMTIRRSGNSVVVSWPSSTVGFILQQNSNPANPAGWQTSGYTVTDDGTTRSITITSPTDNLFFRLAGN